MDNLLWIALAIIIYVVVGAAWWASWDDDKGTLLKRARNDHFLMPMTLVMTWPLFFLKWLFYRRNGSSP